MRVRAIVGALVLAAASLGPVAPAVHASGCSAQGWAWTNETYAESYSPGCLAQARIDRYVGGGIPVRSYYGYWGYTSDVYASNGVNSGNYFRYGPSDWIRIR